MKYKLELLETPLRTRIVHGFDTQIAAVEYAEMEGDHVLDYKVVPDDIGK